MPKLTIDLTIAAAEGLGPIVQRYNEANGTALELSDWIILHLRELAIQDRLMETAETLRGQAQRDADAALVSALKLERERLLTGV